MLVMQEYKNIERLTGLGVIRLVWIVMHGCQGAAPCVIVYSHSDIQIMAIMGVLSSSLNVHVKTLGSSYKSHLLV